MDAESLRIAYLASELSPFAKTGGLADVAEALPRALVDAGHDVRSFVPLYGVIDGGDFDIEPSTFGEIPVTLGTQMIPFTLRLGTIRRSTAPVYFVDCPRFYARDSIYTNDADEPYRFLFFCRAVLESCQRLGFSPHILHANDWQTALAPLFVKTLYAWDRLFENTKSLLTIHNLGYQGVFPSDTIESMGLRDRTPFDRDELNAGTVSFLKTGLLHADLLTTVSPTYADEIQTEEHGFGLDGLLRGRSNDLVGILNGVDYEKWSPSSDPYISFRYSHKSLWRKKKNRDALLQKLRMSVPDTSPLFGIVTRLSVQKGIDLLFDTLPEFLNEERAGVVALGTGEERYEAFFEALQNRFPDRVRFHRGFNDELAHWIEAGADAFLMPSRYEPCGLNQMYSLKYGTAPVVRKTGGLADTVALFDPTTGEGTGIVFEHFTPDAMRWALRITHRLFQEPESWRRMVLNAMAEDFSWTRQAKHYLAMYRRVLIH